MRWRFVAWGLAVCLGLLGLVARAQAEWFTVVGDPADPAAETVQVDPVALGTEGAIRTMNVRVNRSASLVNRDQVPYRSYESQVAFDCRSRRAGYVQVRYFAQPLWQGEPNAVANYSANPRPMLLRDMAPNPVGRLVRAACRLKAD